MQLVQHVPPQRIPWSRYEASSIRLPTLLDSSNSRDQGVIRSTAVQWTDYYRGWNKRSRYSPAPITLLYLPCYLTGNACNEGKDRIYISRGEIMVEKSARRLSISLELSVKHGATKFSTWFCIVLYQRFIRYFKFTLCRIHLIKIKD